MLTFPFNTDVRFTLIPMVGGVKIEQSDMEDLTVRIENKNRGVLFDPKWDITDKGIEIEIQREKIPVATSYNVVAEWRRPDSSFFDGYQDIHHSCNAIEFKKDCNIQCGNGVLMVEASQCYKGTPGVGVPKGGAPGQVLTKKTSDDYDTEWKTLSTGTGTGDGKTPVIGSITAESVAYGEQPSFSLTHTSNDGDGNPVYTGTIKIPRGKDGVDGDDGNDGDDGIDGKTPVFEIGTVETLSAGSQATASIVENGVDAQGNPKYKVSFGIPKGANGTGDGGGTVNLAWEDIEGKPSWIGVTKPTYTASEVGALPASHNTDAGAHGGVSAKVTDLTARVTNIELGVVGDDLPLENVGLSDTFGTQGVALVPVNSIGVTPSLFNIYIGDTIELKASILPVNATNKTVIWLSSNPDVADVSLLGIVTGKTEGEVAITASAADGEGATNSVVGIVRAVDSSVILVRSLQLSDVSLQLESGESHQLSVTVQPEDATDGTVTWRSMDETVATVDQTGLVTAVKGGSTIISVSANDESGVSNSCPVIVDSGMVDVEGLIAHWDFTKYPDGYSGVVEDLSNSGNIPLISGLDIEDPLGRKGFVGGRLRINNTNSYGETKLSFQFPEIINNETSLVLEIVARLRTAYIAYNSNLSSMFTGIWVGGIFETSTNDVSLKIALRFLREQADLLTGVYNKNKVVSLSPSLLIDASDSNLDKKYHIVYVANALKCAAYINGVKIGETEGGIPVGHLYSGKIVNFFPSSLKGDIYETRLYNSIISDEQVETLFNEMNVKHDII